MKMHELEENAAITAFLARMAANMAKSQGKAAADAATKVVPKMGSTATTTARAATAMADQLAQQAAANGVRLIPLQTRIWDKAANKFVERAVPIVNHDGRAIVVIEVNGQRMPFYLSSGNVAKEGVTPGRWYPTFGVGTDGWINKAANVGTYYGKPELKRAAQQLDSAIGDIRSKLNSTSDFGVGKSALADINQGLNPVTYKDGLAGGLREPAYALFKQMGI